MLLAIRFNVASEGCSVRLKGLAQVLTACRGRKGSVQRFRRLRRTIVNHGYPRDIPKLETMKSLNLVTVESRILGPKKLRKVVLVGALISIGEDGAPDFISRSLAEATDSAVLYEMPSS